MEKILETSRLVLRNLLSEDASIIHAYRNDPACARYQRWEDTSKAAVRELIAERGRDSFLSETKEQRYAIASQDGCMIGDLSYFYTEADKCITLGITIAPEHQRRGFAFEILGAVVAAIRSRYPKLDIVALIDKDNTPSIALFEKLGFYRECYAESIASYVYVIDGKSM